MTVLAVLTALALAVLESTLACICLSYKYSTMISELQTHPNLHSPV